MLICLTLQIGQSHPTGLTANLLKLFDPRPPLEFKPPPEKRKCPPYTGLCRVFRFGFSFQILTFTDSFSFVWLC